MEYGSRRNNTSQCYKKPITIYHISNPEKEYSYDSIIEASEQHNISNGRLRQASLRKLNVYGYDGWAILHDSSIDKSETKDLRKILSERVSKQQKGKPSKFKGVTNRWTDEQKAKIGSYHKGVKMPKEQLEALKEHNRKHSPNCKSVTLKHKDNPTKLFTFHSISEASRQLELPISRLKSKAQRPLNKYGKDGWAIDSLG